MNLRVEAVESIVVPKYYYFFNYSFQTNSGTGEGMCELTYSRKKITTMEIIREAAEYIKKSNNETSDQKWSSVVIRNFILLREENTNGIESREAETSSENDPKVSEGSQG